jgi:hypothetical protein
MVSPKPYGLHVIGGAITDKDSQAIAAVIHRFVTFKEALELENLKKVYELPDGGFFIVQDVGGIFKVLVDKRNQNDIYLVKDGLVKMYIPMFFSGVIEKDTVREDIGEKVSIKLTEICRRRLVKAIDTDVAKTVRLARFTIDQNPKFYELVKEKMGQFKRTQFFAHNPGWYSGSMAKAVQFIGGYGRQDFNELPDEALERAQMTIPEKLLAQLLDKYKDVRLPSYDGIPPSNGQFQYEYQWAKTDAIAFDDGGNPWLIRVAAKVWAMPLPIIPITADSLFHEYVETELADQELLTILETFKAFPSGESFPDNSNDFQRWVRAGVIIEICDTLDFHSHQAMFHACGWSFDSRGMNAYNTGWRYGPTGVIEASTFKLRLNLVQSQHHYGTDKVDISNDLSPGERDQIAAYMSRLSTELGSDAQGIAIRYKLRHVPQSEILNRANNFNMSGEVSYWDTYTVNPIAQHTGTVIKLYQGKLYHHDKPKFQPQIKFPDFGSGLCVSFDFTPLEGAQPVECDTVMYIYFDNDVLKVVKYFYSGRLFEKPLESDFEECMTVGSWREFRTTGDSHIVGNFYTTELDDREEMAPNTSTTTVKGEDKGYDSKPWFNFDYPLAMTGTMWRNRYFTHLTKTESYTGKTLDIGIVIPMFNRSSLLYAKRERADLKTESESLKLLSVQDPYQYRYWTFHPYFAYRGGLEVTKGKPSPQWGNPVWVEMQQYAPSPCSDFADNGPWVIGMPADFTWLIHPKSNEWNFGGGGGAPPVKEYSYRTSNPVDMTGFLKWEAAERVMLISDKVPQDRFFIHSPDDFGVGLARTSSKVFLGDREYVNISETNAEGVWKYMGACTLVDHKRAYHFIGVIHE